MTGVQTCALPICHLSAPSFSHYAAAVTFFPHLIAGPIVQYRDMLPQFERMTVSSPTGRDLAAGVALFAAGLFKKQVIADPCGEVADRLFTHAGTAGASVLDAWTGVFAYTGQLYFDFSAYSDMALGLAHLFGIVLPRNFASPYRSASIIEFWRRWHITLSGFLRNYLYIPLGGSHGGPAARYRNLMLVMLLGGLWHGAGWTFVMWGGLHGLYLCANHAWRARGLAMPRLPAWVLTLLAVAFAWVLFRAPSPGMALDIWEIGRAHV